MSKRIVESNKLLSSLPICPFAENVISLDVTNNQITNITDLNMYSNLTTINIKKNRIENVPTLKLNNILSIDISDNYIKDISPLCTLTSLTNLNVSHCQFVSLPPSISKLQNLQRLVCYANRLTVICDELRHCTNLKELNVSNNLIELFPKSISDLTGLTSLYINDNSIQKGFKLLKNHQQLQYLDISYNQITSLSANLYNLKSLNSFICKGNAILQIHKNISSLQNLTEIIFHSSPDLTNVHENISCLTNLENIDFSSCALQSFPDVLPLTKLSHISLSNNKLTSIPKFHRGCDVFINNNCLTSIDSWVLESNELNISCNLLKSLPSLINTNVKKLIMFGNQLTTISTFNSKLNTLDLSFNNIGNVLPTFKPLIKLRHLSLSHCNITSIPASLLSTLSSLETFDCSFNKICEISVERMNNLQELNLHNCSITKFPVGIKYCTNLKVLDLSSNNISCVTKKKFHKTLTKLTTLDLSYNNICDIENFALIESIVDLNISHNPIKKINKKIQTLVGLKTINTTYTNIKTPLKTKRMDLSIAFTHKTKQPAGGIVYAKSRQIKGNLPFVTEMRKKNRVLSEQTIGVIGGFETCGRRTYMEDYQVIVENAFNSETHFIGVFDGHGGDDVSQLASTLIPLHLLKSNKTPNFKEFKKIMKESINDINTQCKNLNLKGGTSSVAALITKEAYFFMNCGDSRAVIIQTNIEKPVKSPLSFCKKCKSGERKENTSGEYFAKFSTNDHRGTLMSERQRIRKEGGYINQHGQLVGILGLTRAFGDIKYQPYVSHEPDFYLLNRTPHDCYIVFACDGVWDVLSVNDIAIICDGMKNSPPNAIAKAIVNVAYSRHSGDNISCIVFDARKNL
ncbi:Protein phosphatase 2C [Entamoeba marina]